MHIPDDPKKARLGLEDSLAFCGLGLIGAGLTYVDWRLACVVVGGLSFGLGVALTFWRTR